MAPETPSHSFELQPDGWENLFSMDVTENDDPLADPDGFDASLNDISGVVQGVLKAIDGEAGSSLPMKIRLTDENEDGPITGIVNDIHTVDTKLKDLKTSINAATTNVLELIRGVESGGESQNHGFKQKLEDYNRLKRTSDTAVEKYNQQMDNHIVSLTTNLAIFAGAVGIVYMSVKKN
jgi:hypothetical protein